MSIVTRLEAPVGRRTWIAAAAAVVVLVVAFGWCVLAVASRSTETAAADARTSLAEQAPSVVASVFTVHGATWKQDRAQAREALAEPLATALRSALAVGPPAGVDSVVWAPSSTSVIDVDGDVGSALITVRVTVTPASGTRTVADRSVQADFTRVDGSWRLSGLDELT